MPRRNRHHLEVRADRRDDECVLTPDGELDLFTAAELTRALRRCGARRLVLDLSKLRFMDSSGLALLLAQHRRSQKDGVEFAISNPQADVRRVLEISGLDRLLAFA